MKIDEIEQDTRERGWLDRLFYPFAIAQVFTPCSWHDLNNFIWEDEKFHNMAKDRIEWLKEAKIGYKISYDYLDSLTDDQPRSYRLQLEFKTKQGVEAYKLRWSDGNL